MIPNLIHPVPITIRQLSKSNTLMDEDFREPIQQAIHSSDKTLLGQISWNAENAMDFTTGGVQESSDGYVLFRYVDLEAVGVTLHNNDRIIKLGNIDVDLYIVRMKPCGHYPDASGATMVKAYFVDRQPSRQGVDV